MRLEPKQKAATPIREVIAKVVINALNERHCPPEEIEEKIRSAPLGNASRPYMIKAYIESLPKDQQSAARQRIDCVFDPA